MHGEIPSFARNDKIFNFYAACVARLFRGGDFVAGVRKPSPLKTRAAAAEASKLVMAILKNMASTLTREQHLELYYYMRLNRELEEQMVRLFRQNKIVGGCYMSLGQEA